MKQLIDAINSFQKLDDETEQAIKKYFVIEKFKKDEFIIQEGKICKKVYFIKLELFEDSVLKMKQKLQNGFVPIISL
jgi:signal-transduction protein with cAMP-binding, CBS, and nucleotidyltransferase domain